MLKNMIRKHKYLPLIVVVLILLIAAAVIVPMSILAAGNDTPQGLRCWHPYPSQSIEDNTITLRFAFTVNSTFNGTVGIVYSFTNQNPTIGVSGCTNKTATLYPAGHYLAWHGTPVNPGSGRKWAQAETDAIVKADYADTIYVRAYTKKNGCTPDYSSVYTISVYGAFIADFSFGYFGGSNITTDLFAAAAERTYSNDGIEPVIPALPPVYPTANQHPRVLFTSDSIGGLNAALANAPVPANPSENQIWVGKRYEYVHDHPTDGDLSDGFDTATMNDIQLLALDYQMTGNRTSGLRAVYAIKNALKTMGVFDTGGDPCRRYGYVMYVSACVYDWCYDLMNATDRQQIVAGVQHKCCEAFTNNADIWKPEQFRMEIDFPPAVPGALTSHNAEFQLLRDYLSFAIAIYDEYPGWWDYIAGRFYQEFVPVRNEYYKAGMYPQGVSTYVRIRYTSDLYSAALIKAATGIFPYESEENMKQVARTIFSYEYKKEVQNQGTPKEKTIYYGFAAGDDEKTIHQFEDYSRVALISSYLFEDETMRAQLAYFKKSYSRFDYSWFTVLANVPEYLIFSSNGVEEASDRHEDMPLFLYNGGWLGQLISRNTWATWQTSVLMKIGGRTTGNHEHYDAGSFQIFFQNVLAGDTGCYDKYGSDHHYYYHQATIAHNSLLIYNPAFASTQKGYYTGGQRLTGETGNFNDGEYSWCENDRFLTGTVTGMRVGYGNEEHTTAWYSYIAGDITPAYDSETVSNVERRMLVDYWGTGSVTYFFVYDNITATNPNFKKTFLLHTPTEPTMINSKTYQVINGNGKMVLQNVIGGDTITKIGGVVFDPNPDPSESPIYNPGASSNYKVNGSQLVTPGKNPSDPPITGYDGFWGRLEVSPATGNATDRMLNVICITHKNTAVPTATDISTSVVAATQIGNAAAAFVKESTPRTSSFSFTTTGTTELDYFVSGVAQGTWTVKRNGTTLGTFEATGGLLFFEADPGTIQLIPATLTGVSKSTTGLGNGSWQSVSFSSIPN